MQPAQRDLPALRRDFHRFPELGFHEMRTRAKVADILRLHYAWILRDWRLRFQDNREAAKALYEERFCRMWEFYLSAAELGFVDGSNMVFQLLLSRKRDAVPLIRDYITKDEAGLRKRLG